MVYLIIFTVLAALTYWYWRARFVPAEVKLNDADITANGSQDNLRKGYHARRNWVRGLTLAALSAGASLPLWFAHWLAGLLGLLAVAVLLTGYFSRYFTPLLNLARRAAGRLDITEYYASSDSASWPGAAVYKPLRAQFPSAPAAELASMASRDLESLLTRTWRYARIAAALLSLGAAATAIIYR
jgi:hypothetical protein